jgi:hypothetical protein
MNVIDVTGDSPRPFFIAWTYPGELPTEVEYELTWPGHNPEIRRVALHEAITVEHTSRIRHRFLWNGRPGVWSDEGIAWKRPS